MAAALLSNRNKPLTIDRVLAGHEGDFRPCWVWPLAINKNGYAQTSVAGKKRLAHRIAYEMTFGPVPAGLVVDHLCQNKACVNPTHLEAVTQAENVRRCAHAPATINANKPCCPKCGRPFVTVKRSDRPGKIRRTCHACVTVAHRSKREATKAA